MWKYKYNGQIWLYADPSMTILQAYKIIILLYVHCVHLEFQNVYVGIILSFAFFFSHLLVMY